jgi:hypothetical protein
VRPAMSLGLNLDQCRPGLVSGLLGSGLSLEVRGLSRLGRPGRLGRLGRLGGSGRLGLSRLLLPVRLVRLVRLVRRGRLLVRGFLLGFAPAWPLRYAGGYR